MPLLSLAWLPFPLCLGTLLDPSSLQLQGCVPSGRQMHCKLGSKEEKHEVPIEIPKASTKPHF